MGSLNISESNSILFGYLKQCHFGCYGLLLFSHWVMSDSLWPHELQHTRLPCPSLSPRVCSNSCLLTWWCYLTISSSAAFFFSCPQTLPASGSFSSESALHIRWPKYWSFSISPSNEYSGLIFFRINWYDLLAVQETLKNLLQHHNSTLTSIHDYWKNHSFDYTDLCWPSVYFCLKTLNSKLIPFSLCRWPETLGFGAERGSVCHPH